MPLDAVALRVLAPTPGLDQSRPELFIGAEGVLRYSSNAQRGLRYEVSLAGASEPPIPALTVGERARYLAVPALPARIAELAEAWTVGATTARDQARLIEGQLRAGYKYDLDSPSGAAKNPLEDFLFKSKRGHCEFYSTAMTVMLRELGVPARNVTGFVGGTYNRFSRSYVVRQGDAHSWVEVWLDGIGWMRFDPTPPSDAVPRSELTGVLAVLRDFVEALGQRWSRHVIGYDLRQQLGLYDEVRNAYLKVIPHRGVMGQVLASPRKTLLGAMAILGLAIGGYQLLKRRRQPKKAKDRSDDERGAHEAAALYRSLERVLASRGVPRPASTPPLAHARALEALGHPLGAPSVDLTERYLRARFGGEHLDQAGRRAYLDRLQALRAIQVEIRPQAPPPAHM
jgi:transglutaminase-like putative cysteine protease